MAEPRLLPVCVNAVGIPVGRDYQRRIHLVYPGGPSAIVPEVVGTDCGIRGVAMEAGANDRCAFRVARSVVGGRTMVGYVDLDLRVPSPPQPMTVEGTCRIAVRYGSQEHVLSLPLRVSFVGKGGAEPQQLLFAEASRRQLLGKERCLKLAIDAGGDLSKVCVKSAPSWLACHLEQRPDADLGLRVRVRTLPERLCEEGDIAITYGSLPRSEMAVHVVAFASRE
jgi:hypothetical protein